MNYNILAYSIYFPISVYITYWVGKAIHKKGRVLMAEAFAKYHYSDWVDAVNNSLLVGYYLLNFGAVFLVITQWTNLTDFQGVIDSLALNIGFILTLLGAIHAFNIAVLTVLLFKKSSVIPP